MIASGIGCTKLVEFLLDRDDVDANLKDINGETALMKATKWRRLEIVKLLLLAKEVKVNLHDHRGFTALHAALFEEEKYHDLELLWDINKFDDKMPIMVKTEIISLLLASNAQVDAKDFNSRRPLDLANRYPSLIDNGTVETLEEYDLCSQQNGDIDSAKCGRTHLHLYFLHFPGGHFESSPRGGFALEALFAKIPKEFEDHRERTALHYLCMYRAMPLSMFSVSRKKFEGTTYYQWIIRYLSVDSGCFQRQDMYGKTPFHYASETMTDELWKVFEDCWETNDIRDENGHTAKELRKLMIEARDRKHEFIRLYRKREQKLEDTFDMFDKKHFRADNGYLENNLSRTVHPDGVDSMAWECWKESRYAFRNPINDGLCEHLQRFINRLTVEIGKRDSLMDCKSTMAGSSYEGTKIDLPTEFDFDLVLTKLGRLCEVVSSSDLPKKGFVHLRRKSNVVYHRASDHLFNVEGFLLNAEISSRFQATVCDVLGDREFWREERLFDWNIENENKYLYGGHTRSLCMTLKLRLNQPINGHYLFDEISIDIVPCVHIDGWWPDGGALPDLSDDLKSDGCNLVFDQPQRNYPWVPYSQQYARISFAPAESRIIAEAPFAAKAAYMVGKHMVKRQGEQTYVLKSCLFYCLETINLNKLEKNQKKISSYEDVTPEDLCFWVDKLFRCYFEFCLRGSFPCFLMRDFIINLKAKQHDDQDLVALAFSVLLNVSLSEMNISAQIPVASGKHWIRDENISKVINNPFDGLQF